MPCLHCREDGLRIVKLRHAYRVEELRQEDHIVECNSHATPGQRMAHVERISKYNKSPRYVRARR